MTRIVAGIVGGRRIEVPRSGTRPTSERVREALFARLIATARREAERIVADDPQLREHRALAAAIVERLDEESQAFLERA